MSNRFFKKLKLSAYTHSNNMNLVKKKKNAQRKKQKTQTKKIPMFILTG